MNKLKFRDIKKLEYADEMPFEYVLVDMLYKKQIDVNFVLSCYTNALDKERHLNAMRFNEACINLTQMLDDKAYDLNSRTIDKRHKRFITKMLERTYGYDVNDKSHISTCVEGCVYTKETIYINIDLV